MKQVLDWVVPKYKQHRRVLLLLPIPLLFSYIVIAGYAYSKRTPILLEEELHTLEQRTPILQQIETTPPIKDTVSDQLDTNIVSDKNTRIISNTIKPVITTLHKVIVKEEEPETIETIQQYVNHNPITRAVPKQYCNARIPGKQTLSIKHPEVRVQLLESLQLEAVKIPKGTYLNGITTFESGHAYITVSMVQYKGKQYVVKLQIIDGQGRSGISMKGKSKLKLHNTVVIVVTQ